MAITPDCTTTLTWKNAILKDDEFPHKAESFGTLLHTHPRYMVLLMNKKGAGRS